MRLTGIRHDLRRIGVDLDMTLVDTRDATRYGLEAVNETFGHRVDVDAFVECLGPPLRPELARYLVDDELDEAIRIYRAAFLAGGVTRVKTLPGAHELFDLAHRSQVFLAVLTSRIPETARLCLDACDLHPDHLIGDVVGVGKAAGIRELELEAFIGAVLCQVDHCRQKQQRRLPLRC